LHAQHGERYAPDVCVGAARQLKRIWMEWWGRRRIFRRWLRRWRWQRILVSHIVIPGSEATRNLLRRRCLLYLEHACFRNRRADRMQKLPDGVAMKKFLIRPSAQEARGLLILNRAGIQNGFQVNDCVRFDIAHLGEGMDLLIGKRIRWP